MPPLYLCFILALLAGPVYVILHAITLVIPLYLLLLFAGIVSLWFPVWMTRNSKVDEVFSLVALMVGIACCVVGFAMSPLYLQILAAIALLILSRRYDADAKVG
jgi:hypothetical protein